MTSEVTPKKMLVKDLLNIELKINKMPLFVFRQILSLMLPNYVK